MRYLNGKIPAVLLFILSVGMLFLGFYRNQWDVIREKKFKDFELDSESLVVARLVESRQNGFLFENGLLGWGDANPPDLNQDDYSHQYSVYLTGGEFRTYSLYKSVGGFQAMFFSLLDRFSPFSPAVNLRNYRALVALLFAMTISIFILWIHAEFGWLSAVVVLSTTIVSQWITLFGHNLFYFIWASFLPLSLIALYFAWEERKHRQSNPYLAGLAFIAILFKCLMNGYDFIIPTLAMPTVPLIYYGLRGNWGRSRLLKRFVILSMAMLIAVLVSLFVLAAQLQVSEGSFVGGLASIWSTFGRRTYGDPGLYSPLYAESLKANPWTVLWTYVSQDTAIYLIGLRFLDLIIIFAAFTVLYVAFDRARNGGVWNRNKVYALIGATWFSILSPLTWFFIFKGQAYVHTFTNYLAWHMPFTLFGYAMCGYVVWSILQTFFQGTRFGLMET